MKGTFAVAKKELKSYFYSPTAYVVIGVFTFLMGVIFAKFVDLYQKYNMAQHFGQVQQVTLDKLATYLYQNMATMLCFITPFVTMRLFSEEKRQQTLELLLTAPIKSFEIVMGKFLAGFSVLSMMVGISFIYVLFMVLWGNPEIRIIGVNYLGLFLVLSCYLSLGMLMSAFTSSQAIAAIFTFILVMFLWILQSLAQGVTAKWGFIDWGAILTYISPFTHFESFSDGVIQLKHAVYFVSFCGICLFLTHRVVESHRWR